MQSHLTVGGFKRLYRYPVNCLTALLHVRIPDGKCPRCGADIDLHYKKLINRRAFICRKCLIHIHPTVDSPWHHSRFELVESFEMTYRQLKSRNGVSAVELSNEYGYERECIFNFQNKIRATMGESMENLKFTNTIVEVDETMVNTGTKGLGKEFRSKKGWGSLNGTYVLGIVERNGCCRLLKIPAIDADTIYPLIKQYVDTSCTISTDENNVYDKLSNEDNGYKHISVQHNAKPKQWVNGEASTNSCESLFSHLKELVRTHRCVSEENLQLYCDEVAYKHNHRNDFDYGFKYLLESLPVLSASYGYRDVA